MARKKVGRALIENETKRRASYKHGTKGLLKQADELSKLCGINLFFILYGFWDVEPIVYSSSGEAQSLISRFKTLRESKLTNKMVSHEEFLEKRVIKAKVELKNQETKTRKKELTHYMQECLVDKTRLQRFGSKDLADLDELIDQELKEITRKMELLNESQQPTNKPSNETVNLDLSLAITNSYWM